MAETVQCECGYEGHADICGACGQPQCPECGRCGCDDVFWDWVLSGEADAVLGQEG